jgi:hypothetical protein
MNHVIAYQLLFSELAAYRDLGYEQLQRLVGDCSSHRKVLKDGVEYELSVSIRWCNREQGDIRVIGIIGETTWGGPYDSVDDTIIVSRPASQG